MKIKRIISAFLAVILVSCMIPVAAVALQGKWGSVAWDITDGRLTVTGGDIPHCTSSDRAPWSKFSGKITSLFIGDGVTAIGDRAFEDLSSLTSISFGKVKSIGKMAFSGCTSLTAAVLPETLESLGDFAFAECSSLKKTTVSGSLSSIGEGVWESCPALDSITGSSAGYITEGGVLYTKDRTALVKYPPAKSSSSFSAPDETETVMSGAFRDADNLKKVQLGGVKAVGDGAFYGCSAITELYIPAVQTIGRAAFYKCSGISEISFGERLSYIGDEAFSGCSSLAFANFAGDAPDANEGIFYGCDMNFTVIVSKLSEGFGEDKWLGYPLVRHGVYSGSIGNMGWSLDTLSGVMTLTGNGAVPDYEYASDVPWYAYRKIIRSLTVKSGSSITGIGDNAFRYSALTSVNLPSSVTEIGEWAFSGCDELETVTAEGAVEVARCAFFGDTSLEIVKMTEAVSVDKQAFSGCDILKYVLFGKVAPYLGELAFDGTGAAVVYPVGGEGYSEGEWNNIYSEAYTAGDANGDGRCNISDVSLILKYIAKWDVTLRRASADANVDGKVNLTDASHMMKYIAKWDVNIGI